MTAPFKYSYWFPNRLPDLIILHKEIFKKKYANGEDQELVKLRAKLKGSLICFYGLVLIILILFIF